MPSGDRSADFFYCPVCRRGHMRNSTIGHLHKVYLEIEWIQKLREAEDRGA